MFLALIAIDIIRTKYTKKSFAIFQLPLFKKKIIIKLYFGWMQHS